MNLAEIRQNCWNIALERGTYDPDRFWPEAEMNGYINDVYRVIARQTRCIRDATTPAVVLISSNVTDYTTYANGTLDATWANDSSSNLYQANVAPYLHTLHASIIEVEEAKRMGANGVPLRKVSSQKWRLNPQWEQVKGDPTEYATDLESRKFAVNFRSTSNQTYQLVVRRLPITELTDDTDTPEFVEAYHDYFENGVLAKMYLKQDAEVFDPNKAVEYRKAFEADLDRIKQAETLLENHLRPNSPMYGFL